MSHRSWRDSDTEAHIKQWGEESEVDGMRKNCNLFRRVKCIQKRPWTWIDSQLISPPPLSRKSNLDKSLTRNDAGHGLVCQCKIKFQGKDSKSFRDIGKGFFIAHTKELQKEESQNISVTYPAACTFRKICSWRGLNKSLSDPVPHDFLKTVTAKSTAHRM